MAKVIVQGHKFCPLCDKETTYLLVCDRCAEASCGCTEVRRFDRLLDVSGKFIEFRDAIEYFSQSDINYRGRWPSSVLERVTYRRFYEQILPSVILPETPPQDLCKKCRDQVLRDTAADLRQSFWPRIQKAIEAGEICGVSTFCFCDAVPEIQCRECRRSFCRGHGLRCQACRDCVCSNCLDAKKHRHLWGLRELSLRDVVDG